jgi:hypothetical protein
MLNLPQWKKKYTAHVSQNNKLLSKSLFPSPTVFWMNVTDLFSFIVILSSRKVKPSKPIPIHSPEHPLKQHGKWCYKWQQLNGENNINDNK